MTAYLKNMSNYFCCKYGALGFIQCNAVARRRGGLHLSPWTTAAFPTEGEYYLISRKGKTTSVVSSMTFSAASSPSSPADGVASGHPSPPLTSSPSTSRAPAPSAASSPPAAALALFLIRDLLIFYARSHGVYIQDELPGEKIDEKIPYQIQIFNSITSDPLKKESILYNTLIQAPNEDLPIYYTFGVEARILAFSRYLLLLVILVLLS